MAMWNRGFAVVGMLLLAAWTLSCGGESGTSEAGRVVKEPVKIDLSLLPEMPRILIKTNLGDMVVELEKGKAPITVKNFLTYSENGFYDETLFHRVLPGFMIQGGGYTRGLYGENPRAAKKTPRPSIKSEADNGLKNEKGTLAMGLKGRKPDSGEAQFFINLKHNKHLDYKKDEAFGFTVFGRVVQGMDVVEKIEKTPTCTLSSGKEDVPEEPVVILSARLMK